MIPKKDMMIRRSKFAPFRFIYFVKNSQCPSVSTWIFLKGLYSYQCRYSWNRSGFHTYLTKFQPFIVENQHVAQISSFIKIPRQNRVSYTMLNSYT